MTRRRSAVSAASTTAKLTFVLAVPTPTIDRSRAGPSSREGRSDKTILAMREKSRLSRGTHECLSRPPCLLRRYAELAHKFLKGRSTGQRIAIVMFKDAQTERHMQKGVYSRGWFSRRIGNPSPKRRQRHFATRVLGYPKDRRIRHSRSESPAADWLI